MQYVNTVVHMDVCLTPTLQKHLSHLRRPVTRRSEAITQAARTASKQAKQPGRYDLERTLTACLYTPIISRQTSTRPRPSA